MNLIVVAIHFFQDLVRDLANVFGAAVFNVRSPTLRIQSDIRVIDDV